ncbi:YkyA family protein [Alkalihalobacterium elongatum]|uniref:YkyA family protein n=1 Tax=Alkalihalobacterium elongatum TaxID=2675466 RepID=UPI001C2013A8|nr:YkyA family protein [Alkalihalobacterium elongatum]
MKLKYVGLVLGMAMVVFLAACGNNPAEDMFTHMEKAVVLEEVFEQQQEPLVAAEKKEHEIYEQIIKLGMSEYEEIVELSKQAISIVQERKQLMDKEKMSIEAGYEEFLKIEPVIEELKEEELRDQAVQLKETMTKRFESYQALYDEYDIALSLDEELYTMLQQEDLTIDDLQGKIDEINEAYEKVMNAKDVFNEYTEAYNVEKKEFYLLAELDITFEE